MLRGKRSWWGGLTLGLGMAALLSVASNTYAADLGVPERGLATKAPRDQFGLPVGGWVVYPSLMVGAVYDDNVFRSEIRRIAQWGLRVTPSFTAELNNGIHRTSLYSTVDARFYRGATQANAVDAKAGIGQIYEAERDLIFKFNTDYLRQADVFSNGTVDAAGNPIVTNNQVNVITGGASVEKRFSHAFVVLGGTTSHTAYDNSLQSARNGNIYTATVRAGFWVTPFLYAYVEPSADWRRYSATVFNSNGYRVVGGIGTDQNALFQGEIFGGYQAERYDSSPLGAIGNVSSTVFGTKLSYFPTRYWTVKAVVDQTLGVSTVATPTSPLGTAMRVTQGVIETNYALWKQASVSARAGYNRADYVNSPRLDNAWLTGATVNYTVWQNLGVTFDYQYSKLQSNVVLSSYSDNRFTVGGSYKY